MKGFKLRILVFLLLAGFPLSAAGRGPTLFEYVKEYGDVSFAESGVNELDSAIFSMLSYIRFEGTAAEGSVDGVSFKELSDRFFSSEFRYSIRSENWDIWQGCLRMFETAARHRRYADIRVRGYVNIVEEERSSQFSAIVFSLTPALHFIAFRGTDTTMTGWRENFLMTCESETSSQKLAMQYVDEWAPRLEGTIHIGGHSKGANLAIYAAAQATPDVQERIESVWNFDGPGFSRNPDMLSQIEKIKGKIKTFVPDTSLVGMLMRNFDEYTVVKSDNKLFLQHDLFSWHVNGRKFGGEKELSGISRVFDTTLNSTIASMSDEQFHALITLLFDSMEESGIHNVQDIGDNIGRLSGNLAKACVFADKTTRKTLLTMGKYLVKNFGKAVTKETKRK